MIGQGIFFLPLPALDMFLLLAREMLNLNEMLDTKGF